MSAKSNHAGKRRSISNQIYFSRIPIWTSSISSKFLRREIIKVSGSYQFLVWINLPFWNVRLFSSFWRLWLHLRPHRCLHIWYQRYMQKNNSCAIIRVIWSLFPKIFISGKISSIIIVDLPLPHPTSRIFDISRFSEPRDERKSSKTG